MQEVVMSSEELKELLHLVGVRGVTHAALLALAIASLLGVNG
jgi:hypothetical protein